MSLALEISRIENVAVVVCRGRIVFGDETTEFCRSIRSLLPEGPHVILNLQGIEYIDSGGLGSIVGLLLAARRLNGDLGICQPSSRVENLLRITKLWSVVPVFPAVEDGIAEFRKSKTAPALKPQGTFARSA